MINYALYELRQIWKPVNFFLFILLASVVTGFLYSFFTFFLYFASAGIVGSSLYQK